MLQDAQCILSTNQSLIEAAGSYLSQNAYDTAGVGAGNAPPDYFGVSDAVFGEDIGIGDGVSPPRIMAVTGPVAFAGGGTVNIQIVASVDSGVNGNPAYSPNAYEVIAESGPLTNAQMPANSKVFEMTIPPRAPGQAFPRFYALQYTIAGTISAGSIANAQIITGIDNAPTYPAAF